MRPALRPVLPGMRGGIGAHEPLLPVGRRTVLVVLIQRLRIVLALVAEERTPALEARAGLHQPLPVVMADLVAEVSKHRSIRLVQGDAPLLALGIVGLAEVQGDHAARMAGFHRLARRVGEKLEDQAVLGILHPALERDAQPQQAVHEAPLRGLELVPGRVVGGVAQIRNDAREAARTAQRIGIVCRQRPVADVVLHVVFAQPVLPAL